MYIHGSTLLSLLCTCSLQPPAPCSIFSLITCQNTPSWHLSSFLPLSHQGIYLTELSLVFWRSKWESESVLEITQQKTTALFQTEWVSSPALRPAVAGRMGILRAAAVPRLGEGRVISFSGSAGSKCNCRVQWQEQLELLKDAFYQPLLAVVLLLRAVPLPIWSPARWLRFLLLPSAFPLPLALSPIS